MARFSSPATQAKSVAKALSVMGAVKSISTSLSYEECLKRISSSEFAKVNRVHLRDMTVQHAHDYLEQRSHEVGKTLDMERQALQSMLRNITCRLAANERLQVIQSDEQQKLTTRTYTPRQIEKILSKMEEKNALSTELAHAAGLRAHELLTILPISERGPDFRPATLETKFKGLQGIKYTVTGKGGLTRVVLIPHKLAARLEGLRLTKGVRVRDRGIWYIQHYGIAGGHRWTDSFSYASKQAVGWSNGGHGLRHTYAQERMRELQVEQMLSREVALETISQELGHFRPDITETYLR